MIKSIIDVRNAEDWLEYSSQPMDEQEIAAERVLAIIDQIKREDREKQASDLFFQQAKADGWYRDRLGLLIDRDDR